VAGWQFVPTGAKLSHSSNLDQLRYLILGTLYCLVYLGLGVVLGGHPLARTVVANGLLLALALAICAVILWRRREWEGTHRLFWDAFGLGIALWGVGLTGFTINSLTGHRTWVEWHTLFSVCGAIGPTVALLAMPHTGVRKASSPGIGIELISYAMLIGFIDAYFVMVPTVVPAAASVPQAALLTLVQAQRFVLFAGLVVSFAFAAGSPWRPTFARLALGAGAGFALRFATNRAISAGRFYDGSIYDLAWIVPYFCYLWAASEAPRSVPDPPDLPARRCRWDNGFVSAIPVLVMPIVGFGLLRVQPLGEPADTVRLMLTTMGTVAGLGLLTVRVSMQSGELQRTDARLRLLAAATEQTADLILITRSNGAFEHANDACVQALGYTRDELSRTTLEDLLEHGFERMVDHIGLEVRQRGIWRGTLIHRRKDGSTFPASSTVVALRNNEGHVTHFVGVQRDITEELRLRDQLVHTERLSAVGELVAGVAHEINNPLQTIVGCIELLIEERKAAGQELLDLQLVRQEAGRAGQIVRNLLSFVRRGSPERSVEDLNQIARVTAALREQHLRDENVRLLVELHPGILPILVNREEIQQIVLNLVLNAEHAIGDKSGTIVIRTNAGEHAHRLEVMDDGPGVPPELRGRVFEPFFTTKDVGQGTGLGLSIALGIATAHGGSLELAGASGIRDQGSGAGDEESGFRVPDPRRGARFVLTLPAHTTVEAPQRGVEGSPPRPPVSGRRRALIVEDEAPIRSLLARLVARRDYDIVEASSCAEAKAAAAVHAFDLVLCDLRLADGNGREVLRCLRERQPEVGRRFVFVSGDIGGLIGADREIAQMPRLNKPFTASDLDQLLDDLHNTDASTFSSDARSKELEGMIPKDRTRR
jgi:PAS domain S-box-containing protein